MKGEPAKAPKASKSPQKLQRTHGSTPQEHAAPTSLPKASKNHPKHQSLQELPRAAPKLSGSPPSIPESLKFSPPQDWEKKTKNEKLQGIMKEEGKGSQSMQEPQRAFQGPQSHQNLRHLRKQKPTKKEGSTEAGTKQGRGDRRVEEAKEAQEGNERRQGSERRKGRLRSRGRAL